MSDPPTNHFEDPPEEQDPRCQTIMDNGRQCDYAEWREIHTSLRQFVETSHGLERVHPFNPYPLKPWTGQFSTVSPPPEEERCALCGFVKAAHASWMATHKFLPARDAKSKGATVAQHGRATDGPRPLDKDGLRTPMGEKRSPEAVPVGEVGGSNPLGGVPDNSRSRAPCPACGYAADGGLPTTHEAELHAEIAALRTRAERAEEDNLALEARRAHFAGVVASILDAEPHLEDGHDCYERTDDATHRAIGGIAHDKWLGEFYARDSNGDLSPEARRALSRDQSADLARRTHICEPPCEPGFCVDK